ncbi:Intradiol ring-cleavage dioxygenase [Gongronella butleri]|nr:Intradiol ring-cleavage dioxygenase [Gongronella butleri]
MKISQVFLTLAAVGLAFAHPEGHEQEQIAHAAHHVAMTRRAVEFHKRCSSQMAKRHLMRRCHTSDVQRQVQFNTTCILTPEVTQGPYYVDNEVLRANVTEGQPGVPLKLDLLVMNINTCEPYPNAAVTIWHANSTGVYSGYEVEGTAGANFLRGAQITNDSGVVAFDSVFPGWYTGRAVHIHTMVHINGSKADNGSYIGGTAIHTGQLFFAQELIDSIASIDPYATSTQQRMNNTDDSILQEENSGGYNAYAQYEAVNGSIENGIVSWITLGVDENTQNGDGSGSGTGGGAPPSGSGSPPSGSAPSGSPPSGAAPAASAS